MKKRKPGRPKKAPTTVYPLRFKTSTVNRINSLKEANLLKKGEVTKVAESAIDEHINTIEQYQESIGFEKAGYHNDLIIFTDEK